MGAGADGDAPRRRLALGRLRVTCRSTDLLNRNPLDFAEHDLVARAVVELGGLGRLVGGDLLGLFNRAAVLQVCRYSRCSERVTAHER